MDRSPPRGKPGKEEGRFLACPQFDARLDPRLDPLDEGLPLVAWVPRETSTPEVSPPKEGRSAMVQKSKQFYEARARIAKALAHPSRLLILDVLKRGEHCVSDLTKLVGADQSTVSKHIAILKNAGLVGDRKEGSMTYYGLRAQCLDGFFGCMETLLVENLKARRREIAGG
jgi:ArsR family transcriptional regulator